MGTILKDNLNNISAGERTPKRKTAEGQNWSCLKECKIWSRNDYKTHHDTFSRLSLPRCIKFDCRMTTERVTEIRKQLEKLDEDAEAVLVLVEELAGMDVTLKILQKTKIGFTLNTVRKEATDEKVKKACKDLLKKWKNLEEGIEKGESSSSKIKESEAEPAKDKKGRVVFSDFPDFQPNLTPKEVLQLGSFGGTYFRPIYSSVTKQKYKDEAWQELPASWLQGLNIRTQVASSVYDNSKNKYGVKCGASLEEWESSGWMHKQDPYGWFQWYCRFYQGRRTEDDVRQVGRWSKCTGPKGRWKNNLISKCAKAGCAFDNFGVSPVVRQTLQHWGYVLTKEDFEKEKARFK